MDRVERVELRPWGEHLAYIDLGERGLQVSHALRGAGRYNVLWAPGGIEALSVTADELLASLLRTIASEGARKGLDVSHRDRGDGTFVLRLGATTLELAELEDGGWGVSLHAPDEDRFTDELTLAQALARIAQETARVFSDGRGASATAHAAT